MTANFGMVKIFYSGIIGVDIPKTNNDFWKKKIQRNIARDHEVNLFLQKEGWIVLRFWEKDIK